MRKELAISFVFLLLSFSIIAQERTKALKMLGQRGEIYIKFTVSQNTDIKQLNKIVSIDNIVPNKSSKEVFAYLNKKQFASFEKEAIDFELLTPPSMVKAASMCTDLASVGNWNCYPTYPQYLQKIQEFESNYPNLCKVVEFGRSVDGRKLLALKISDNAATKEEKPAFFYTSSMHGDEVTGYVLMLRLIDYLLSNYGTDSRVTDLVNNTEIWINPLSNPDGTYAGGDYSITGATRANSNGYDLNRNFPDPIYGLTKQGTEQPETTAMIDFLKSHSFVLSANFHGGVEVVNYPWDSWKSSEKTHADDAWYQKISKEYADTVHANSSNYMLDFNNGITEGADWYYVIGGRQDYVNYYLHSREVTIEISSTKVEDAALLPVDWEYNYRSFLNYINRVHTGVYGKVTDPDWNPLYAKIRIANHDVDSSEIYSDVSNGMYYRMIDGGTYHLIASKPGYYDSEYDVDVSTDSNTELNIVLQPWPLGFNEFVNSKAKINGLVNPVLDQLEFNLELMQNSDFNLSIIDISGKQIMERKMYGQKGDNRISLNLDQLSEGIYFCTIQSACFDLHEKLFKIKK